MTSGPTLFFLHQRWDGRLLPFRSKRDSRHLSATTRRRRRVGHRRDQPSAASDRLLAMAMASLPRHAARPNRSHHARSSRRRHVIAGVRRHRDSSIVHRNRVASSSSRATRSQVWTVDPATGSASNAAGYQRLTAGISCRLAISCCLPPLGSDSKNKITLLSLDGVTQREVSVPNATRLVNLNPLPNGQGFFQRTENQAMHDLVSISQTGNLHTLWAPPVGITPQWAIPSPDGKTVAMPQPCGLQLLRLPQPCGLQMPG